MTGRELHGRQEEWPPTHTLHLATNHLPAADDASEGFDAEEEAAREPVEAGHLSPREVLDYLRSLPALWSEAGPDGRQALATAIFARTDVMGFEQMTYELTPDAIELGLAAALPAVFELSCSIAEFGRGERI